MAETKQPTPKITPKPPTITLRGVKSVTVGLFITSLEFEGGEATVDTPQKVEIVRPKVSRIDIDTRTAIKFELPLTCTIMTEEQRMLCE